ncbi:MAG: CPBP family intramembrane metalloprotease [Firmicutes bacterium]|nr:CPBP family intramembrane metalloprotease [Bacillota bacterium]
MEKEKKAQQPQSSHKHKIWNKDNTFVFVCAVYLLILVLFAVLRVIAGSGLLNIDTPEALRRLEIAFSLLSQVLVMTIVPIVAMYFYRKRSREKEQQSSQEIETNEKQTIMGSLGFDRPSMRVILWSIALGFLIYFFNIFVASFFIGILSMIGYRLPVGVVLPSFEGVGGLFMVLFLVAVLPGICEEITHRGFLMNGLVSKLGVFKAILFSSILFGFMHMNVMQVFYAAILGYIMGVAMFATKSIWTPIIMHFLNNAIGVYLSFAHNYGWFGGNFTDLLVRMTSGPAGMIVYVGLVIFLVWSIIAILHMFSKERFIERIRANGDDEKEVFTQMPQLARMKKLQGIKYYLEDTWGGGSTKSLKPLEKTLFYGVLFLGGLITVFTLVWGLL